MTTTKTRPLILSAVERAKDARERLHEWSARDLDRTIKAASDDEIEAMIEQAKQGDRT